MKVRAFKIATLLLSAGALLWQNGCGGSSANQVVDTVSPATSIVVAATTQVYTSTVTGSTNLDSTWTCTYVYTPAPTTATPNPTQKGPFDCTSGQTVNGGSIGTWTTDQTTADNTLSYTSPDLTNFPNPIPILTFTAAAAANTNKKGTAVVNLDTGIRIAVSPATATAPVGLTPAQSIQFSATLATGAPLDLNWKVMQPVVGSSSTICNDFPALFSGGSCGTANPNGTQCSPSCGTIDPNTGIYTAPASMPTDTSPITSGSSATTNAPVVTVVVWKSGDIDHFATATITLVNASTNPITFTGISPTTIAAGGVLQDIWLDAHNFLNTTAIYFTSPSGAKSQIDNTTNVFTIPITAAYCTPSASGVTPVVTCDASIVTRIRLTASQLAQAGTATISATIPVVGGTTQTFTYPLNIVYAKPALVSGVPFGFPSGVSTQLSADGGYYGNAGNALVQVLFNGNTSVVSNTGPRQFTISLVGSSTPTPPGLYPLSVAFSSQTPPSPPPYTSATTDVAVQPSFSTLSSAYFSPGTSTTNPTQNYFPGKVNLPPAGAVTNLVPSSMAINSVKAYGIITEQGSNTVQLFDLLSSGNRFAPSPVGNPVAVGNQPTGVAIDPNALSNGDDLGVVVNSADSTLSLLDLTPSSVTSIGTVSLSGLVSEPPGTTAPLPFSVGVDPITHYALVAFSNATLGFIVYVNPNTAGAPACFVSTQTPPCATASVSLNTGPTPQIVMQPDAPLAYVTPGGTGVTSVVSLLTTNNNVAIAAAPVGATCTNGIATITTPNTNNLNQASPGAVLISGVTPATFNGTYNVLSATNYTFTYVLTCATSITGGGGNVTFGNPYYTFSTTATATGAAINPITHTFAYADPNVPGTSSPQLGFISSLDQSVTSLSLTLGSCQGCSPIPAGAPEPGVRSVSWDPYRDILVAYDPSSTFNLISLINPGGPTANGNQPPYRIIQAINTNQNGQGSYTPSGASSPVTVYGPMVYDPRTNLVLVGNAGSNTLTYFDIDAAPSGAPSFTPTFKDINISDIQVTSGGVASGQPPLASAANAPNPLPVAQCQPNNPTNPYGTCFPQSVTVGQPATITILGQGFLSGGTPVVRLDGDSTGVTVTAATDTSLMVSIAASRFSNPHTFALDVLSGAVNSNTGNVYAVGVLDLSKTCSSADMPEGVAFDDIRHVGLVTNYGCNTVSIINMDTSVPSLYPGVPYGTVMSSVTVGANPIGIATIPRLGYAVTANNGDSSASIINISNPLAPAVLSFTSASCTTTSGTINSTNICVGIAPTGVAIDQDRALVVVANTGGNSVSAIDLTPLLLSTPGTPPMQLIATSGPPYAIAVDSNRAEAVVTNVQNTGTSSAAGGLDVLSLATVPPSRSSTASISSLTANPTGIVVDPALFTSGCTSSSSSCSLAPALFYVASTQQNAVYTFNPDTSATSLIPVGVNPYSLGYNFQTGTMISINSTSNTSSIIDTVNAGNSVFATRNTLGIASQSQFAVTVDNFTNTALIADQNNNRALILALPQ
jgi:DNA-binding beta-propeller fold protein YncE